MHFKKFMICLNKSTFVELLQQPIKRLDACIEVLLVLSSTTNWYNCLERDSKSISRLEKAKGDP